MTANNRVEAVRSAVAALNQGDIDGYFRRIDPSCKRWVAGLEHPLSVTDIRGSVDQLHEAFADLYLHEDLLFGTEQFVCARWRMQGIHVKDYMGIAARRRKIDLQTCEIYSFGGDLVSTVWSYGDSTQLFRQIGAGD
jgi:predicted ester cyclase